MGWLALDRHRHSTLTLRNHVAVGMRQSGKLAILIGDELREILDAAPPTTALFRLGTGSDAGKARLVIGHPDGNRFTWTNGNPTKGQKRGSCSLLIRVGWAHFADQRHRSVIVPHRLLADRVVEIDLPDWARPQVRPAAAPFTSIDRAGNRPPAPGRQ